MNAKTIRIGGAAGFWGDSAIATPPEVVKTLSDLINRAMESEAGKEYLVRRGLLGYPGSPRALLELQTRDTERWGRAIKAAGIQAQ